MLKTVVSFVLIFGSVASYAAVIPLTTVSDSGQCTELADKDVYPSQCSMFLFAAPSVMVNQGDTFNITCTFSVGQNNSNGIPGDVVAMVVNPVEITSGQPIPTDQDTPIPTNGVSSVKFSWTGKADAATPGTFFGISFKPPSKLRSDQTIKVSCANN